MEYNQTNTSRANLPQKKEANGLTIFVAVVTAIAVFAGALFIYSATRPNVEKNVPHVTVQEAAELKNNDNAAIVISRKSCVHCQAYKPNLEKYAQANGVKFYIVDLDEGNNQSEIQKHQEFLVDGTPTTLYFQKGKMIKQVDGEQSEKEIEHVVNELKGQGFELPKV